VWSGYTRAHRRILPIRDTSTVFGSKIRCNLRDAIGQTIYHFGVWEPHISAFVQARLRPGDLFCDVGANIGYYSLLASQIVGETGRVIAFEASPSIFEQLQANLRRNYAGRITAVHCAVTETPGMITIYRNVRGNTGRATIIPERGQAASFEPEQSVPGRPLHDLLSREERLKLRLIKIDVEGAEQPILRSVADRLTEYSPALEIVCEVFSSSRTCDQLATILAQFRAAGFRIFKLCNSYDPLDYLNFSACLPPELVDTVTGEGECDLLLSRNWPHTSSIS
jgi:FkbM family methyltransferase